MSNDKRSVSTDALATLGTLIDETAKRDAIHLAVTPMVAMEQLYPGQHIGIVDGMGSSTASKKLGIVDPFVNGAIPKGAIFWLIVYPRQITSLRHVWEHPDFVDAPTVDNKKKESEEWLRDWCSSEDAPSYERIMDIVVNTPDWIEPNHFFVGDEEATASIPEEFWDHIQNVTGKKINHRPTYFRCAC